MRICSACKIPKENNEFYKCKRNKDGLVYLCKNCCKIKRKTVWKRNPILLKIRKKKYYQKEKYSAGRVFNIIRDSVKRRNIELIITKKEFKDWYNACEKKCEYCRISEKDVFKISKKTKRLTIDRKNSNIGYLKNNLVLACDRCNRIKGSFFTYEEMLKIGEIIKNKIKN